MPYPRKSRRCRINQTYNPLTQLLYQKANRARTPLSGTFELSPLCNLSCRMCYVRKTAQQVRDHPRPMVTMEQWLRLAEEARQEGMLFLLLTGGEPFLWQGFQTLYEQLRSMGFVLSINSNGTLIDADTVSWLKQKPPQRVNVTLYGASNATYQRLCGRAGMFDRAVSAIDRLQAADVQVKINCSITPQNVQDFPQIVEFCQSRSLLLDAMTYMFPPVRRDASMVGENDRFTPAEAAFHALEKQRLLLAPEAYRAYLQELRDGLAAPPCAEDCATESGIHCQAGRASFWITWDGYMTPCGMMNHPRVDLQTMNFQTAWRQTVAHTDALTINATCAACPNQRVCHACPAMAAAETGSHAGVPTYLCTMAEELRTLAVQYTHSSP